MANNSKIKLKHWVLPIIFLTFILGNLLYGLITNKPDRSNWLKSEGRITGASISRSKWRKVEHYVNGIRKEEYTGIGLNGNCIGDVYEILVNPKNLEDIYLLNERPLFLKDEAVGKTIGWIKKDYKSEVITEYKGAYPKFMDYDKGYNHVSVRYYYIVNNKQFQRVQDFSVPVDSILDFKKGMKFQVRYWLENPQRSILDYNEKR